MDIINNREYPETKTINRLSSILCFVALKLSNFRRYSADNLWCMDRGLGLFAGLNVLPKAAWFTSYSDRVTSNMNKDFLSAIHLKWSELGLLGDTENMDFTTIPYWGDDEPFENNWSGKRGKALTSMLAVLAHDPDTGIISYGNTDVKHKNESNVVLEFLDFYRNSNGQGEKLNYLVFDSKFTSYENLSNLNVQGIKFITIRRRGKNLVDDIRNRPASAWKKIRVPCGGHKNRTLKVFDETTTLRGYKGEIRQIVITDNGKIKPAIIITNDFDLHTEQIVRKYARRWNVEKLISEQIEFFHLNKVSSSMVIKVDFDLTMSILAHNIYRLI
ncbi:MAG: transposase, partial [Sphingobacterium sp.]